MARIGTSIELCQFKHSIQACLQCVFKFSLDVCLIEVISNWLWFRYKYHDVGATS